MITCRVLHPFTQFYEFRVLCCHINLDIGRDSFSHVRKPFDHAGIFQRRNSHRLILIVDLGIQFIYLELRYHIYHTSHLPVTEKLC